MKKQKPPASKFPVYSTKVLDEMQRLGGQFSMRDAAHIEDDMNKRYNTKPSKKSE